MAAELANVGAIAAGQELTFLNAATDARTIFCDGFNGLTVQPHVTKISFFEQMLDPLQPGSIKGRFVLNLAIPNDQFVAIANLLKKIADELPAGVLPSAPTVAEGKE
jgi:hypothetical protein